MQLGGRVQGGGQGGEDRGEGDRGGAEQGQGQVVYVGMSREAQVLGYGDEVSGWLFFRMHR